MKQGAFNKISELLSGETKIVIPDLQRDYCWGETKSTNNSKSLVHNFTEDLIKESLVPGKYGEYSYGLFYAYEYPKSFHYLCDGQQRITTLYLICGIIYCHTGNSSLKTILQVSNTQPRLKYEVRNSTDYFLKDLLKHIFLSQNLAGIDILHNTNWFRDEYRHDPSIKSIVRALQTIKPLITSENVATVESFLLNTAGVIYFNLDAKENSEKTNSKIREYGEKMYEVVNTRGNPMEPNEHFKSSLISNKEEVPEDKRTEWTEKWEAWQDFFWQHRGNNESADRGFNHFLKWIGEIEQEHGKAIYKHKLEVIEDYFKAFFALIHLQETLINHRKFCIENFKKLLKKNEKINEVALYPCLIYLKGNDFVTFNGSGYELNEEKVDIACLFRFIRFFTNLSRNSEAKNEAIELAKNVIQGADVATLLLAVDSKNKLPRIFTSEEKFKLRLFALQENDQRTSWENNLWEAEDHSFLNGEVNPLFSTLKVNLETPELFDLNLFSNAFRIFSIQVNEGNLEKTRYALLCINELSVFDEGRSWGVPRYYLGLDKDIKFWRNRVATASFISFLTRVIAGESSNSIIEDFIDLNSDDIAIRAKKAIILRASSYWQWIQNKRFFIYKDQVWLPNGVQAKENTQQIEITTKVSHTDTSFDF